MRHKKQYQKTDKHLQSAPMQAMRERIFDTRKGLKKFLKRKFG